MYHDYVVVTEVNTENLVSEVNRLIDRGYQPVGGIAATVDTDLNEVFFQAMAKVADDF
jgi:hypothetical protein